MYLYGVLKQLLLFVVVVVVVVVKCCCCCCSCLGPKYKRTFHTLRMFSQSLSCNYCCSFWGIIVAEIYDNAL